MRPWYTGKPCEHTKRSHINVCVYDSRWEANESFELDRNQNVRHGSRTTTSVLRSRTLQGHHSQIPARLSSSAHKRQNAVLEVKGQDDQQQQTKREFCPSGSGR